MGCEFWTKAHKASRYALRGVSVLDTQRHVLELDLAPVYEAAGAEPETAKCYLLAPTTASGGVGIF